MSDTKEKLTSIHPVAYPVKPEKPHVSGADVSLRMGIIAALSGGIALLARRIVYPELRKIKPDNLPESVPVVVGLSAVAATAALAYKEKGQISRRHLLYSAAAGLGAGIGAMFGSPPVSVNKPITGNEPDGGMGEGQSSESLEHN